MQTKPSLILLRGLPGSGKSTLAGLLSEGGKYPVHAVDHYFTDEQNGEYVFDFRKNHLAFRQCETRTEISMKESLPKIFVDNTFTIHWELEPYIKLAAKYDYQLFVLTVEKYHDANNVHDISSEQLEKMAAKYKVKLM